MLVRIVAGLAAVVLLAASVLADTPARPYAGQQDRALKALSDDDVAALRCAALRCAALRKGEGMGMAKAAELNGYPGPAHVLQMAAALQLTADQNRQVADIHARMNAAAKPLGAEIIEREQSLDQLLQNTGSARTFSRRRPRRSANCKAGCARCIWPPILKPAPC
jgi:hypothetical protein